MFWIIGIIFLIMLIPLLRIIGILLLLIFCLSLFTSSDRVSTPPPTPSVMTYQELVDYPVDCKFKDQQLVELKNLQTIKNFNPDPDLLTAEDYDFNARLKATIWWYAYRCEES